MPTIIDQFAALLDLSDSQVLTDLRDFVKWCNQHRAMEFAPHIFDDVYIRSYLLHLKLSGADGSTQRRSIASLKHFYEWAQAEDLIPDSSLVQFDFDRPLLSQEQIRRREETLSIDPVEREIARLRTLNHLAGHLNCSADIRTMLDTFLETLVQMMGLKTAWVSLWTEAGLHTAAFCDDPPHDFTLVGCCGLPPGLEKEDHRYLCQPPDCLCQKLLRADRLVRAVNVIECTRLQDAAKDASDTEGLLFHATVPLISQDRRLGLLNIATEKWEFLTAADLQLLSAAGSQVATALERASLYDLAETQRTRLEQELEMARAVQRSFLPSRMPDIPHFTLVADWCSASEVAGDFYDVISLPDGRWGIILADVSGKGAPAALYMAMTRSLIRSETGRNSSPSAVLTEVNRRLLTESSANQMFVTVFYAVLDPAMRSITYANAGHHPPFLRRSSGDTERLPYGDLVLGLVNKVNLTDRTLNLESGDSLVAYSDGLTDTVNPKDEEYGFTRLAAVISAAPATAPDILTHLLDDLAIFAEKAPPQDDITLLVLTSE